MKDYYAVLSVPRGATDKEVKERFRQLVRERHPDRFQGEEKAKAEADFQAITEALSVLMDPKRRLELDASLDRPADRDADHQQKGRVLLSRGVKAFKEGNYLEAASNFHRATEADPASAKNWYHLALACAQEKRWVPKGLEAVERAMELTPDHPPYLKLGGKLYAMSGDRAKARQIYSKAASLGSHDAEIQKALAELGVKGKEAGAKEGPPAAAPEARKGGFFGKLF